MIVGDLDLDRAEDDPTYLAKVGAFLMPGNEATESCPDQKTPTAKSSTVKRCAFRSSMVQFLAYGLLLPVLFLASSLPVRSAELVIEDTKFVVQLFSKTESGTPISQDLFTTVAPLVPGQCCFGWRIKVSADIGIIKFREEFTVPSEPEYWSGEDNRFATNVIINDGRTSITKRFAVPDKGWIENFWCFAEGDPEGNYSMRVYFNGRFVEQFDFEAKQF